MPPGPKLKPGPKPPGPKLKPGPKPPGPKLMPPGPATPPGPKLKQARSLQQIFNRKSISRNATHRQSLHLQAVLTGETLKG